MMSVNKYSVPQSIRAQIAGDLLDRMIDLNLPVEQQVLLINKLESNTTSFPVLCMEIDEILDEVEHVQKEKEERV